MILLRMRSPPQKSDELSQAYSTSVLATIERAPLVQARSKDIDSVTKLQKSMPAFSTHGRADLATRSTPCSGFISSKKWSAARPRQNLICLSALLGVFQNDSTPMIIDNAPFFDLLQGSKAAETCKVIV
jgi:hypothetical protein